jgi:hypothetical protein
LKPRHVFRPRARSLCGIEAPVTGYKRKISVHAEVPLLGESTLIFANTLWRGAKVSRGLFLEEPPKPVLEHGVQGFAVAGKPRVTHRTMQVLLFVCQIFPFNNRPLRVRVRSGARRRRIDI